MKVNCQAEKCAFNFNGYCLNKSISINHNGTCEEYAKLVDANLIKMFLESHAIKSKDFMEVFNEIEMYCAIDEAIEKIMQEVQRKENN